MVSLCPSITRLLFDLDAGHMLVGITKYCIHPAEAVANIEKVGGTKDPDIAQISQLKPDLILLNKEENRREDWQALKNLNLTCHSTHPVTLDETVETVRSIGAALNRDEVAERVAHGIEEARLRALKKNTNSLSFVYLIWRKPWMTINANTYINCLLQACGGTNVFADAQTCYPAIETDQIKDANPDMVLLSSEPFPFKEKHIQELSTKTGLDSGKFRIVDGELLSWHGAFTEKGLDYACELFSTGNS